MYSITVIKWLYVLYVSLFVGPTYVCELMFSFWGKIDRYVTRVWSGGFSTGSGMRKGGSLGTSFQVRVI